MTSRFPTTAAIGGLLVSLASGGLARAECAPVRDTSARDSLPGPWRAAVDRLVESTAEAGHPWSCSGGHVELELTSDGAIMRVARGDEPTITRRVAAPEDVVPLGEALLAAPLAPAPEPPTPAPPAPPPPPSPLPAPARPSPTVVIAPKNEPRVLLCAAIDMRAVGGVGGGWIGPSIGAAVPFGAWLPGVSLRVQGGIFAGDAPVDDLSFAFSFQRRIALRALELRPGVALRGAVAFGDLPRPQGSQTQLQGRVGAMVALAIPVVRWANVVLSADADVVALKGNLFDETAARTFPTFTAGGSGAIEVPL